MTPFFFFEIWNLRLWNLKFENFPFGKRYSLSLIISKNLFSIEVTKFWNWCHLSFENFENFSSSFFLILSLFLKKNKTKQKKPPFFGSRLSLAPILSLPPPPHLFCTFLSSFFLLPPLLLFTSPFHLDFLPHYTISSLKNHFPKLLNLLSLISPKIFSDLCVLDHFCHKPNFETHLQTSIFFCIANGISNWPSFLTFNGKKYHPSLEWNDGKGLFQDPKTHASHSNMDFKVSLLCLLLFFFIGIFVDFMFYCKHGVETLSFGCCLL